MHLTHRHVSDASYSEERLSNGTREVRGQIGRRQSYRQKSRNISALPCGKEKRQGSALRCVVVACAPTLPVNTAPLVKATAAAA